MEVEYIGVPFRIEGYSSSKWETQEFTYTWYWVERLNIAYGSSYETDKDLLLSTEAQFYQAITLVNLGFTDKETLQQLLGI